MKPITLKRSLPKRRKLASELRGRYREMFPSGEAHSIRKLGWFLYSVAWTDRYKPLHQKVGRNKK